MGHLSIAVDQIITIVSCPDDYQSWRRRGVHKYRPQVASQNNCLIAKHKGYHMFTPLRTRGVERDLLPERFTLPELTNLPN